MGLSDIQRSHGWLGWFLLRHSSHRLFPWVVQLSYASDMGTQNFAGWSNPEVLGALWISLDCGVDIEVLLVSSSYPVPEFPIISQYLWMNCVNWIGNVGILRDLVLVQSIFLYISTTLCQYKKDKDAGTLSAALGYESKAYHKPGNCRTKERVHGCSY